MSSVILAVLIVLVPASATASTEAAEREAAATVPAASALPSSLAVSATPDDGPDAHRPATPGVCTAESKDGTSTALPVNRWTQGMSLHSRLHGSFWKDTGEKLQRDVQMQAMFGFGNAIMSGTAGMVEGATAFCPLDTFGGVADGAAKSIGTAITVSNNSIVLTTILSATALVVLFSLFRQGGQPGAVRSLLAKALIIAAMGVMVAGASQTTGGEPGGGEFKPGTGSPGWIAQTVDSTISQLAAKPAAALSTQLYDSNNILSVTPSRNAAGEPVEPTPLSCASYVRSLHEQYRSSYGTATDADTPAMAPASLSTMWEMTGLRSWTVAQTGAQNGHGQYMYCRILESNVSAPVDAPNAGANRDSGNVQTTPATVRQTLASVTDGRDDTTVGDGFDETISTEALRSLALQSSDDNKKRDRAYVGWATCRLVDNNPLNFDNPNGWQINGSRQQLIDNFDGSQASSECHKLFNQPDYSGDYFDWDEADDHIKSADLTPGARDFLRTLHGTSNSSGIAAAFIYVLAAFCIGAVFGGMAIAIFVAKLATLGISLSIFFILAWLLLPASDATKLGKVAKVYLGLSLFAFGAQVILSIIVLMTMVFITIGMAISANTIVQMVWAGGAPIVAVLSLHLLFKQLKVPSPMTPSGAMSYGRMAVSGGLGAAAGAGAMDLANRGRSAKLGRRAKGLDRGMFARKKNAGENAGDGSQRMRPDGQQPGGAAGGEGDELAKAREWAQSSDVDTGAKHRQDEARAQRKAAISSRAKTVKARAAKGVKVAGVATGVGLAAVGTGGLGLGAVAAAGGVAAAAHSVKKSRATKEQQRIDADVLSQYQRHRAAAEAAESQREKVLVVDASGGPSESKRGPSEDR